MCKTENSICPNFVITATPPGCILTCFKTSGSTYFICKFVYDFNSEFTYYLYD